MSGAMVLSKMLGKEKVVRDGGGGKLPFSRLRKPRPVPLDITQCPPRAAAPLQVLGAQATRSPELLPSFMDPLVRHCRENKHQVDLREHCGSSCLNVTHLEGGGEGEAANGQCIATTGLCWCTTSSKEADSVTHCQQKVILKFSLLNLKIDSNNDSSMFNVFLCATHPSIVKVRLVVTTKAVVGNLELLGSVHVQSCNGSRRTILPVMAATRSLTVHTTSESSAFSQDDLLMR
ncbi:hypothetical protein E2C01_023918 [Portunus trituberculatus]|uniref:Uncharacterized protein n=1 Tax=Portunus trituberculatus TaxID=210409 RepID=A0A5B7E955_PORTR|nr:hypothetical protein [Portunus trituberculatus]